MEQDSIVKRIVYSHLYDTDAVGHTDLIIPELYIIEENGLEIGLLPGEDGTMGYWNYDFGSNQKTWISVPIPDSVPTETLICDGQLIEATKLISKWLETHQDTDGKGFELFFQTGLHAFLKLTGQE